MSKRAYTIENIEAIKYERFDWELKWAEPFGNPAVDSSWFILGPSASGKSSFVMQLGRKLCSYGSTLYVSYEEGVRMEFQRRLKYLRMNEVKGHFSVVIDDSYEEYPLRLEIQTDLKLTPEYVDFIWQDRRILSMHIQNFTIL